MLGSTSYRMCSPEPVGSTSERAPAAGSRSFSSGSTSIGTGAPPGSTCRTRILSMNVIGARPSGSWALTATRTVAVPVAPSASRTV